MRDWLKMSGAATRDLDRLEEKTRSFHLSEGQIRQVYPAPVTKALLPVSMATKLKTCVGKAKSIDVNQNSHFTIEVSLAVKICLILKIALWSLAWALRKDKTLPGN